jgi:PEP-CTERM motif
MRRIRRVSLGLLFLITAAVSVWAFNNRPRPAAKIQTAAEWSSNPSENLAIMAGPGRAALKIRKPSHPVYNYSVVPGGVHTVEELREVTSRDRTVAEHYAGFRYDQARVVTLARPRLVYLSYRKKGAIYWTGKRHRLPAGEKVITDGKIVARTKCANRIEIRKQLGTSPEEPTMAQLEEVDPPAMPPPAEVHFPAEYHTALLTSPGEPGGGGTELLPSGGLGGLPLIPPGGGGGGVGGGGGGGLGGGGGCETPAQEKHEHDFGQNDDETKETHCPTKPPAPVPEPNTILLMSSGLAAVYYVIRKGRAAAQNQ